MIFLCGVSSAAFDAFRSFDRFLCYKGALGHIRSEVPSGLLRYISLMNSKYCCCIQFSSERGECFWFPFSTKIKRDVGNALLTVQNEFQQVLVGESAISRLLACLGLVDQLLSSARRIAYESVVLMRNHVLIQFSATLPTPYGMNSLISSTEAFKML